MNRINKNITMSADETLIKKAREKAAKNKTSLNELFRQWLVVYTKEQQITNEFDDFVKKTEYAMSGGSFTRDELNKR